jgi:hypothetical protein
LLSPLLAEPVSAVEETSSKEVLELLRVAELFRLLLLSMLGVVAL